MGRNDWYRHSTWNAETEATFNAKLARTRSQRAQYLRIQGSCLKDSAPAAAVELLRRCVQENDEFHVGAAYLEMAHAHHVGGDIDAALVALEAAIEQEARAPRFRTSAPWDYAMLVVLYQRLERYERVLALLEAREEAHFASMQFQAQAARAIIFEAQGRREEAQAAAQRALEAEAIEVGWIPGYPQVGVITHQDNPLSLRIRAIAGPCSS